MKKIAYIFPQFPVSTQTFAVSDIVSLRAMGCDVAVYTLKPGSSALSSLSEKMGVPSDLFISRPGAISPWAWLGGLLRNRAEVVRLMGLCLKHAGKDPKDALTALISIPRAVEIAEAVRAGGFEIAHAFWGRHPSLVLGALANEKASRDRPLLSIFVGAYDLVKANFLVDCGLAAADVRFTHSESNRTFFEARGYRDVNVVHRGIPLSLANGEAVARDENVILTASALTVEKNIEGVIDAFARLRASRPALRLWIAGGGPDEARLKALVEERGLGEVVKFWGYVSREQLFGLMAQSNVFLFLSRKASERLPNVIKEAMLAGSWVVSSRSQGIEELIVSDAVGAIVDAANDEEVDAGILKVFHEERAAKDRRIASQQAVIVGSMSSEGSMQRYMRAWSVLPSEVEGRAHG